MIFDTHCHLNHDDIFPRIDEVINNATKANVKKFLVVGYDKNTSVLAVKIAEKYQNCYAAVGFHPTEINDISEEDFNEVLKLSKNKKVVAIGEIGLDYYWVKDPILKEIQKEYFIQQIEFANYVGLPIVIHCRDAINDCLEIVKEYKPIKGGIMHCFSGSPEIMKEFIKLGFYISFGGPVTFKNAKTPKEAAEQCPQENLLVETDSPYLTPHPFRGMKNEPMYISYVLDEIANLKGISKKHVEDVTYKNALRLFNINENDN